MPTAQEIYEAEKAKAKKKRSLKKAATGFDDGGEMVIKGERGGKKGVTIGERTVKKQRRSKTIGTGKVNPKRSGR